MSACRKPLAIFILLLSFGPALAEDMKSAGSVVTTAMVKRTGESCDTGLMDNCKAGQTCFVDIEIRGEAAKTLFETLRTKGIKSSEVAGDYVGTKSNALTCSEAEEGYVCAIGYDASANGLVPSEGCDLE